MIKLHRRRDAASIPGGFKNIHLARKYEDLVDRYYAATEAGRPIEFVASKWRNAKPAVRQDSLRKCAYCEAITSTTTHGDVEHFRPKAVYWWLAYDLDNFLFACQICNQVWKGDRFPVNAPRLASPAMPPARPDAAGTLALAAALLRDPGVTDDASVAAGWSAEDADLVHPYLEDPEPLLAFEVDEVNEEIWIVSSGSARSDRFIAAADRYLGLNREDLRQDRYGEFVPIAALKVAWDDPGISDRTRQRLEATLRRQSSAKLPFTAMRRFFLRDWGMI